MSIIEEHRQLSPNLIIKTRRAGAVIAGSTSHANYNKTLAGNNIQLLIIFSESRNQIVGSTLIRSLNELSLFEVLEMIIQKGLHEQKNLRISKILLNLHLQHADSFNSWFNILLFFVIGLSILLFFFIVSLHTFKFRIHAFDTF